MKYTTYRHFIYALVFLHNNNIFRNSAPKCYHRYHKNDNPKSAKKSREKIMQRLFASFFLYLHHYAFCTFFVKFWEPFLKNGHFYFSKNVQNQKRPTNLEWHFFEGPY